MKKKIVISLVAIALVLSTVIATIVNGVNVKADGNKVLEAQQWLNNTYANVEGFKEVKETGYVDRSYVRTLAKALQLELGFATSECTGTFGNKTWELCPELTEGDNGNIVTIMQASLLMNGYNQNGDIDGIYDSELASEVAKYQEFMCLPNRNGQLDKGTIKSLLVTSGDVERASIACDTVKKLDVESVSKLKESGYTYVGRYLTNLEGGMDKKMTREEAQLIIDNGLKIIPIFSEASRRPEYFTKEQGMNDAVKAISAADELGLPSGTILYFAVEYDCLARDVKLVEEYFKAINEKVNELGNNYLVGVYSTRMVCSKISEKGLAKYSYVNDASTGYEGNLGHKMPSNWAFDQFAVDTVIGVDNSVNINKVAISGRDVAVSSLDR